MPEKKEWTLMFYFASDNPLAPGIVSQLKSLKDAGYHPEVNVLAYFDPQPVGTPTHIFDVNAINKLKDPNPDGNIGFVSNDPYVRDLIEDRLWRDERDRNGEKIKKVIKDQLEKNKGLIDSRPEAPAPPSKKSTSSSSDNGAERVVDENGELGPNESFYNFLKFCADNYPANHYMLFILGHGLVVGDDVFLFDEHAAKHSVTLRELGDTINKFKDKIRGIGQFELISFHSCSMSSLEVAFELQDTANYMLASQGPAFVGSWPYRQILLRIFNDVAGINPSTGVENMLERIFKYVYHNSANYLLAGYSFDLCLCSLKESNLKPVAESLINLSKQLVAGLKNVDNPLVNYCILLAHWKSQSYWRENYTDLYDFCFCLDGYCKDFEKSVQDPKPFKDIQEACSKVMQVLKERGLGPVIIADFAGPDSQYSHGLSVFFPWARPTSDRTVMKKVPDPTDPENDEKMKTEYELYKFNQTEWFNFLSQYWGPEAQERDKSIVDSTQRGPRKDEMKGVARLQNPEEELLEDIASLMFNSDGPLNINGALGKENPPDPTGDACTCASIKNYLRDTRTRKLRGAGATKKPAVPASRKTFSLE